MDENPKRRNANKDVKKQNIKNFWPLKVLVLAVALSLCFSVLSEFLLGETGLVVAIIVIVVFVALSIITDMIGVAATSCSKEPFVAMASKKVRGSKEALILIKNADRVSSICCDVVGDVCGILSGAAGASIVAKIVINASNYSLSILIASLVASIIAGATIFGKALGKRKAISNCTGIMLAVGKVLSLFTKQSKSCKKKTIEDKHNEKK